MQKLDFVITLKEITEKLGSQKIAGLFSEGFTNPINEYRYSSIIPLLFDSKSQLDQLMIKNKKYQEILSSYNVEDIYSTSNLANATKTLQFNQAHQIISNAHVLNYYIFHNSLIKTLKSVEKLFLTNNIGENFQKDLDDGVLIFLFINENEGVEPSVYSKIFIAIEELFASARFILTGDKEGTTDIVFLDSGSDTNLGIKTDVETAKGVFALLKEIWECVIDYQSYKEKKIRNNFLEGLALFEKIKEMQESNVLSDEEAQRYRYFFKSRTDELIKLNLMPKIFFEKNNSVDSRKLLKDLDSLKLLNAPEENNNHTEHQKN